MDRENDYGLPIINLLHFMQEAIEKNTLLKFCSEYICYNDVR